MMSSCPVTPNRNAVDELLKSRSFNVAGTEARKPRPNTFSLVRNNCLKVADGASPKKEKGIIPIPMLKEPGKFSEEMLGDVLCSSSPAYGDCFSVAWVYCVVKSKNVMMINV